MKTFNQPKPETLEQSGVPLKVKRWLAIRKKAGLKIDANSAKVRWQYGYSADPYGVYENLLTGEEKQIQRVYFARSPRSKIWVCFYDLAKNVREALWQKHKSKLAFPYGVLGEDLSLDWLSDD